MTEEPPAATIPEAPYRGLESFDEEHRDYFFGREVETETIAANLITSQLTIFYGTSGVGKTSVLRAGVIPFVHGQPDVTPLLFRSWREETFQRELKNKLAAAVRRKCSADLDIEQPLDRCLGEAAKLTQGTIVVIFDQFEEYMLYHPPSSAEGRDFDTAFARAVNRRDVDANFLIAIRDDALARLDRFRHSIPDLLMNRIRLHHLDAPGAQRAIRMPLLQYNRFVCAQGRDDLVMKLDEKLIDVLIEQVHVLATPLGVEEREKSELPEVTRVETPFLQMVLQKMWEAEHKAESRELRLDTLRTLGDAQKIVSSHVDNVMGRIFPKAREAAWRIFGHLVTPSRTKIAHKETDLINWAGKVEVSVEKLLLALCHPELRLLRAIEPVERGGEPRYEIFHDILSLPISQWRHAYQRGREWDERMKRSIIGGLLTIALITILAIISARSSKDRERIAEAEAETARARAAQLTEIQNQQEMLAGLDRATDPRTMLQVKADTQERIARRYLEDADLGNALLLWRQARDTRKQIGDKQGESRAETSIDTILQEQEWQAVKPYISGVATSSDPSPDSDKCTLDRLKGEWTDGTGNSWWFTVGREPSQPGGDAMTRRTYLSVRVAGQFLPQDVDTKLNRQNLNSKFTGTLRFQNGSSRSVSIPLPDAKSGCKTIASPDITLTRIIYDHH